MERGVVLFEGLSFPIKLIFDTLVFVVSKKFLLTLQIQLSNLKSQTSTLNSTDYERILPACQLIAASFASNSVTDMFVRFAPS
ncbi:MAG: hypothetical protein IIY78_05970, partial [Clostridia bacterium]|nr:hypothetical protein [Clostridia bacterium]